MSEIEPSRKLDSCLSMDTIEKHLAETENCSVEEKISESSEISFGENFLQKPINVPNSTESFQSAESTEEKINPEIQRLDPSSIPSDVPINKENEDEWLDIMGSGNFKKKIIKPGLGFDTRPQRGDMVTADISLYANSVVFEESKNLKFVVGDLDVIQGIDLAICLMEKEEKAKVIIPSKLAYGSKGRLPEVPSDTEIECDIELKEVEKFDPDSLALSERLKYGNDKRVRGNYFYERGEFIEAIFCYERAADYLEGIRDCSGASTELSQEIVDMKIKVYNNMAASHLKLSAYSAALKSVELVLKVQPKNVKALFRKAKILGAQGSTEEAITCLRLAASLEPETKIIQVELSKFQSKKKKEDQSQKAMYQRMFPQPSPKMSPVSKVLKWSLLAGSVLAVAVGMAAYRQSHS